MSTNKELIKLLLHDLDERRENVIEAKAAKKALEETIEYKAAVDELKHHPEALEPVERELRALGLEVYKEKGEKDIAFGMKHKAEKVPTITNEVRALEYCRDKFFDGLAIDKKALEKHAKNSKYPLDFITISEVDKISLPKEINLTALELASGEITE